MTALDYALPPGASTTRPPLPARRLAAAAAIVASAMFLPLDIPWLPGALMGSTIIHLWTRPSRLEILRLAGLAWGFTLVRSALSADAWQYVLTYPDWLGFYWGHASLLLLTLRGPSNARYGAFWLPVFVVARGLGIHLLSLGDGPTADGAMFLLDHAIGDPAYRLGQWLEPHPALATALSLTYHAVVFILPVAYGAALADRPRCNRLLWSSAVAGLLGVICYRLVPVAGPEFAFDGWPALPDHASWAWMAVPSGRIRTGMPSLHLTWAVLAWWFAGPSPRWVRPVLLGLVLTTCVSTIGLGQHYLVDLLAAPPLMVGIIALWSRPWLAVVALGATAAEMLWLRSLVG